MYFRHISPCFYSNSDRESSFDAELNSTSNKYPLCILLTDLTTQKTRNTWKTWWIQQEFNSTSNEYPLCILLMDPATPKTRNTWKMKWWHHHFIFQVFLVFGVAGSIKSMLSGYSLDEEFNSASSELSRSTFEWEHREICRKYEQKSSFFLWYLSPNLY